MLDQGQDRSRHPLGVYSRLHRWCVRGSGWGRNEILRPDKPTGLKDGREVWFGRFHDKYQSDSWTTSQNPKLLRMDWEVEEEEEERSQNPEGFGEVREDVGPIWGELDGESDHESDDGACYDGEDDFKYGEYTRYASRNYDASWPPGQTHDQCRRIFHTQV